MLIIEKKNKKKILFDQINLNKQWNASNIVLFIWWDKLPETK